MAIQVSAKETVDTLRDGDAVVLVRQDGTVRRVSAEDLARSMREVSADGGDV